MNELSVNISGAERAQIGRKAVDLFLKTATARHPNKSFYADITKRIYLEALDSMEQYINHPIFPQMRFVSSYSLPRHLGQLKLPDDISILNLCDPDERFTKMIFINTYLDKIDIDSIAIPSQFKNNDTVLFPFRYFGENKLTLSTEIKDEINIYNDIMKATYDDLNQQLASLMKVIDRCKTTKMFYKELPNLTSLFPNSLVTKINNKNDTGDIELTEEQQLMRAATNAIATANLLGD